VIGRVLIQRYAEKAPQAERVLQAPGDAALRLNALEIPDHPRTEIDARRQPRTAQLIGIEPGALLLNESVEALAIERLVQTNIEGMARTNSHIPVRHPQILLPLPTLARAHRHNSILRVIAVEAIAASPRGNQDFHHRLLVLTTLLKRNHECSSKNHIFSSSCNQMACEPPLKILAAVH
jgi:hypothetical protein